MFDKLKEMFETFSSSKSGAKDPTLRTLTFRTAIENVEREILIMLNDLKYREIKTNIYHEIFATKAGYEITCHMFSDRTDTHVDFDVYGPTHTGKTRKALRYLLHETKKRLAMYE